MDDINKINNLINVLKIYDTVLSNIKNLCINDNKKKIKKELILNELKKEYKIEFPIPPEKPSSK